MSDVKLFRIVKDATTELPGRATTVEKSLQTIIENNLEPILGVKYLDTEYDTGAKQRGRIDTLGIDENGCPVIIEYKRSTNENVINQGLFYLDWLLDHRAEFQLMVLEKYGKGEAKKIDWSAPRLLCIAGGFNRYDEHAVQQMNRNIELIRYRRFGEDLLLLELVNAVSGEGGGSEGVKGYKTISETIAELKGPLKDLHEELCSFLLALGDDVQEKTLKYYVAFKRIKNFACVEVHPGKKCLSVFVKVNPDSVKLEKGFTRDVRKVGHYGTGDLEITIRDRDDLNRAKDLIITSYEAS